MRKRILTATATLFALNLTACAAGMRAEKPAEPAPASAELAAPGAAEAGGAAEPAAEAALPTEPAAPVPEAAPMHRESTHAKEARVESVPPVPPAAGVRAPAGRLRVPAHHARMAEKKAARPAEHVAAHRTAIAGSVERAPEHRPAIARSGVKAGEWDDNANYNEFKRYLSTEDGLGFRRVDVRSRRFLVVQDKHGKGVPNCRVSVSDSRQHQTTLTTTASGRAILFPFAEGLRAGKLTATARCLGTAASKRFSTAASDGVVDLKLGRARALPARPTVDIAFVLDTTGSMSEEIAAVKQTIRQVAAKLDNRQMDVRIGLVEYKDRTDPFVTRVYQMSSDVRGFSRVVSHLSAEGGGDRPESVDAGLHVALTKLAWSPRSQVRMAFLIGDAPPHLDYANDTSYTVSMRDAAHRGVQLFTIAASGMGDLGQVIWRQIAQYTGGTEMFVLRGGAGPQSTGGGDPKSSCGGTQTAYQSGNLDALIIQKIRRQVRALDQNPLRIAGLNGDENAKPCSERLVLAK